ncbi:MAG: LysR family transcriptional regulator [Pseudonocardiales bacterium]|nr:LysR family transcriptional regulator [Pseudonocardiales bacterium]MBV9030187.1 LysR family transcriptional regulator [Pseudonocardiales bacterium]MBW0009187.1 LysR family transcriptional regulator [Pseudonocardiales bacterium]
MTESRLRTLVALAATGSVRGAASRLTVTESAVSSSIGALARELGVPLVEPVGRGLRLTPSGVVYARYARRVLGLLDEGAAAATQELDAERGRLRLAAVTTAGEHLLPALLAEFRRRHPGVALALEVAPSARVWDLVSAHEVDLVIAGAPPSGVDARVIATKPNELVVVAAPSVAEGFDWASTPWLLREQGSATRTRVETYLKSQHAAPPRLVLGSNGAVVAGAVAELGCALVSRDAVTGLLSEGRLVVVPAPGTPLRRPWHAVVGAYSGASTWLFVRHLHASGWRPHGSRTGPPPDPPTGGRAPRRSGPRLDGGGVDRPVAVEGEP